MTDLPAIELPFLGDAPETGSASRDAEWPKPRHDDEKLPDVDSHLQEIRDLVEMLEHHFRPDPQVHVGSEVPIYYLEGDPAATILPDLFVLRQVGQRPLPGHFKLWEGGPSLAAVIEVSSSATREEDQGLKRDVCERFGVEEFFLYDRGGDDLEPRFRGYRLSGGKYRTVKPGADGAIVSDLGLSFSVDGGRLIVLDTASGEPLMHTADALEELERLRGDVVRMLG